MNNNPFNKHGAGDTLESIHNSNEGKVSNKWSSYLTYYDKLLKPIKEYPVSVLEIGVQNGGSLETWSKYFINAQKIIGCDIDEKCRNLVYEDQRVNVLVGNVNSNEIYQEIMKLGPFDVIIDDGSHLSEDILICFLNYFTILKPGGIFIVEDTHAIYMREETNILNKNNALEFFKDLTDLINHEFWFRDESIDNLLGKYLSIPLPNFLKEGWIESLEFRNSIVTIHKSKVATHRKLGEMTVTGNEAIVDMEPLRVRKNLKTDF